MTLQFWVLFLKSTEKCVSRCQVNKFNNKNNKQYGYYQKEHKLTNVGKSVEKKEPSYTVGVNVNLCSHCEKQYGAFWKKLKIELPCEPAMPLMGIYPKNPQNTNLKRYMHTNVHSSIIYNCQDMEAT